ncbi:MAG TPA: hypothetical protein ENH10_06840 [Bacteroidetes bacterium]|nr:hypothetical protein [Bacteroidota bacterium]HEX04858.1 hypothetical protein [Bacteroidota bacterium]
MTIKTQLINIAVFLASLLMDMRGVLLSFVRRYGNAGFYAPTATESTPSNSKDTTQAMKLGEPCKLLPLSTDSNPDQRLQAICAGRVGLDSVMMDEWVQLVVLRMVVGAQTHLNVDVPYGGGLYSLHHHIEVADLPVQIQSLMEKQ